MHVLDLLPSPNIASHACRARAPGEPMEGSNPSECNLGGAAFVVIEKSSPQFEPVVGFAAGIGNPVSVNIIGDVSTNEGPKMLGKPGYIHENAIDIFEGLNSGVGKRPGFRFNKFEHAHPAWLLGHHMVFEPVSPVLVIGCGAIEGINLSRRLLVHIPFVRIEFASGDVEQVGTRG